MTTSHHINSKTKRLLLLTSVFFALSFSEVVLRVFVNVTPGIYGNNIWFEKVDTLQLLKGFQTDSAGIFCIDTSARGVMNNYIARQKSANLLQRLANFISYFWQTQHYSQSVYLTPLDYTNIFDDSFKNTNRFTQNEFSKLNSQTHKGLFALIKEYYSSPINEQGFRSIPFKQPGEGTKKVLLLGDSFTWGSAADRRTSSFADLLLQQGYAVYNTGIPGADALQYQLVAQQYIELIKPDIVICNFFMGNDVCYFDRSPYLNYPIYYHTNAGNLYSYWNGILFTSAESIYDFILQDISIPTGNNLFNQLCSATAITTLLWKALNHYGLVNNTRVTFNNSHNKASKLDHLYSHDQLMAIKKLSEKNRADFVLVSISDFMNKNANNAPHQFDSLEYFLSPVTENDYDMDNGHFNDSGHALYARFLQNIIDSLSSLHASSSK